MKNKIVIGIILVFATNILMAQNFESSFNSTFAGRNISLLVSKNINENHEFGGGLRINLYNLSGKLAQVDDQNKVFQKRLYMTEPLHFFGLSGFYHRNIFSRWNVVKPFLFYSIQATYSPTRNRDMLPYAYDFNGDILYKEYIEIYGPFSWIEQHVGVGFKANLVDNFFLVQRIGYGATFILGYDDNLLGKTYDWFDWNFSGLISVGIGYQLKN